MRAVIEEVFSKIVIKSLVLQFEFVTYLVTDLLL